jgi:hypothetical protein
MDAIRDELRRPDSPTPTGTWETVLEARAQELAAKDVLLEEITVPALTFLNRPQCRI